MIHLALIVASAIFLFCVVCAAGLAIVKMFQVHVALGIAGIVGTVVGVFVILSL